MSSIRSDISPLDRFQSFIVFEPASIRISDNDILYIGNNVQTLFDESFEKVSLLQNDIKMKILLNKFEKIGNMLSLLESHDNVIITKFFDRIWRRYSYVSHLGESLFSLDVFLDFFPKFDNQSDKIVAQRIDVNLDEFDEDKDEDEDEDEDDSAAADDGNGEQ
ncbi:hypothetical protein CL658_00645 [bacterium]|nr:hypothetical protein [bacterium]|tara:strand:+ start:232 stop:720 length:489 start_codon:yes stop_codon:yes gene_type:complete